MVLLYYRKENPVHKEAQGLKNDEKKIHQEVKEDRKENGGKLTKDEKKEIKYYLIDKGAKADYHGEICQGPKDATVTGKVEEKDKKMTITDPKVEFKK